MDVRLVAATHRDLSKLVREHKFREDLYFRINVVQLKLPPLRDRGKDILTLAETFVKRFCTEMRKNVLALTPEAIQAITTYSWPGNIRELENAMQRSVIMCDDEHEIDHTQLAIDIDLVRVDRDIPQDRPSNNHHQDSNDPHEDLSLEDYFQRFVLEHQDSMSETELARKLGVSRKCLWERRQRLGIPRKKPTQASVAK